MIRCSMKSILKILKQLDRLAKQVGALLISILLSLNTVLAIIARIRDGGSS